MLTRRAFLAVIVAAILPAWANRRAAAEPTYTITNSSESWETNRYADGIVLYLGDTPRVKTFSENRDGTIHFVEPYRVSTLSGWTTKRTSSVVTLDLEGTERLHRANRRCAILGRAYARHGITQREQARLTAAHCQELDGQWVTDRIFTTLSGRCSTGKRTIPHRRRLIERACPGTAHHERA